MDFRHLLLPLFCLVGQVWAGNIIVPTESGSGIEIELVKPLSQSPPHGHFPVLVKIHNGSDESGEWSLSTSNAYGRGGISTQTPIPVAAGKSAAVWVYAPVGEREIGGAAYRQFQVTLRGPKVLGAGGTWTTMFSHSGSLGPKKTEVDFPGLSAKVTRKGESALLDRFKKDTSGLELDYTQVDLDEASGDWRTFSGLGQLWMTDDEWSGLEGGTRTAVMDWLTLGGRMVLLTAGTGEKRMEALKLPPPNAQGVRRVGAGSVALLPWDGVLFPTDAAMPRLLSREEGDGAAKLLASYHDQWRLPELVGVFSVHGWLIFGFILVFGVLVGPVNLFYFAGARQRHRMFWTTPLISLAGGVLLVLVMIFQDGIGGSGARRVLAIMNPALKKTAVVQEQVSRTGVLLWASFSIPEPVLLGQLALSDPSVFHPGGREQQQNFESGDLRSGDWFASRSVQAHLAQTVRPSRGGIEFYTGEQGNPSVVSSLAAPLREVYVVDERGNAWKAQDVATGVKKTMTACGSEQLQAWLSHVTDEELGPVGRDRLTRLRKEKAYAFAASDDAETFAVPTLRSIRWKSQGVFFAGPYERH